MRPCSVCGSSKRSILHRQYFIRPNMGERVYYDVNCCDDCGFCFADSALFGPDGSMYVNYHLAANHLHECGLPDGLATLHRAFFNFVTSNIEIHTRMKVLDIGASMGHFLNLFKRIGLDNVEGLEPSKLAAEAAMKHYGIRVHTGTVADWRNSGKFDLVILSGVLEHMYLLNDAVSKIGDFIESNGFFFISTPNASRFNENRQEEPFLEFSIEHINFFSKIHLENILHKNGFELIAFSEVYSDFYKNFHLMAIFRKSVNSNLNRRRVIKHNFEQNLQQYITASKYKLSDIDQRITPLVVSQAGVVIWGAGGFLEKLLANSILVDCNIQGIVDRNTSLTGQELLGFKVYPISWLAEQEVDCIVIASSTYAAEIRRQLSEELHWSGDVIVL